jgi:glycosyltransferase involved in cell wall biosynthesis
MSLNVSVLLPCYRIDSWFVETLTSIQIASKSLQAELILVANNMTSADIFQLSKICEAQALTNYKVVDAGNVDLVGALNFGISHCSAELIARMDQDDIMFPERLEIQVRFMNQNPDIALVGAYVEIINAAGDQVGFQTYPQTHKEIVEHLKYGNCFAHPAVMYRKSAIQQAGLYNPLFTQAEDFAMYTKLSEKFLCANLPDILLKYRINSSQTSQKQSTVQKISTRAIIISTATEQIPIDTHLNLPSSNDQLSVWMKSVNSYVKSNFFAQNKEQRKSARRILNAISRSHIAMARSSGYPGNRQMKIVIKELALAFILGPSVTLNWVRERINKEI